MSVPATVIFTLASLLNPNDSIEMAEAERLWSIGRYRSKARTGEHGIGCGKMDFLIAEHGDAMSVMRAIKEAIDPDNIMNPGKILRV
jgi:D-lactate dehydrogenase (cytochrome)